MPAQQQYILAKVIDDLLEDQHGTSAAQNGEGLTRKEGVQDTTRGAGKYTLHHTLVHQHSQLNKTTNKS
jgi:hypothetical protein